MENELLIEFLKEAKKQTYANANVKKSPSSRLGSNDYHYEKESRENQLILLEKQIQLANELNLPIFV